MSLSDKLEDCKKCIRSILIPYQKGCYFSEFDKAYKGMIGGRLPAREFGYHNEIEFLCSMPDVVRITVTRTGDYHLQGVADEKTMHIKKMVEKQKPSKLRAPPPRAFTKYIPRTSRTFTLPPRFSEPKRAPEPKLYLKQVNKEPLLPKPTSREPLLTTPTSRESLPMSPQPLKAVSKNDVQSEPKIGPMQKVISLVQSFKDQLPVADLLVEYRRMYNQNLSLSTYGFSSTEECIESIPELKTVRRNNVSFLVHEDDLSNTLDNQVNSTDVWDLDPLSDREPTPDVPSDFNENEDYDNGSNKMPCVVRNNFKKVAERFKTGILASDFPTTYEEVAAEYLDIRDLGYTCLSDVIDDVPDIFVRHAVAGSRKDYIIYPAKEIKSISNNTVEKNSTASLQQRRSTSSDFIVLNLRKILEAYPEGILLENVLDIYSINCKHVLHIEDFGFTNLEAFLLNIKARVPLTFDLTNGKKSIHLLKICDNTVDLCNTVPDVCENEAIPFDAVFPDFQFKPTTLPDDFDYSTFVPVFTSAVAGPDALYIHLQNEKTEEYQKMARDMDLIYEGSQSEIYLMKNVHIKNGASCVAKWPADNHWYRAQILSIPSMESVKVCYVDFGTKDTIPKSLLRYAKKEFVDLPAQVIICRLACLKPPKNGGKWGTEARNRILSLCGEIQLMGKFTEPEPDGFYNIILCDTNGDEDIFINDVLVKEGLAELDSGEDKSQTVETYNSSPAQPEHFQRMQMGYPLLNPLQALQAQYFLKAFAAVAPSFAQNENYINLLQQVSVHCQNVDPMQQNIGMPFAAPMAPPGFMPNMNTFANPNAFNNAYASGGVVGGTTFAGSPVKSSNVVSSNMSKMEQLNKHLNDQALASGGDDGDDIFEDDDEESFEQFCQKISSTAAQCVKRVMLGDGYKLHVITVNSERYASSCDISHLIWKNKEADYLFQRLQLKEVGIPSVMLSEDDNEKLFQQLKRYNVKGVQKIAGLSSIILFPLKYVIQILNEFGHPSITLRTRLAEEIASFNPLDDQWKDISPEVSDSEEDDDIFSGETDDDKIETLCLFDLQAMKESINFKRKKMMHCSTTNTSSHEDEINELEKLYNKVLKRIQEINKICKEFS